MGDTNTYSTTYAKFDGYKEQKQAGSSTYFQAGATTSTYDVNGNLTAVSETFATSKSRSFVTDAAGHILQKTENGKTQNYFYANGKPLGSSGALGAADFDYNYTPVSAQYPASTPGSYVVSAGDTLRGIALAVFGDAQLWYLIADANGLKTDADLTAGRNLTIPNKVTNLRNAADTYKPYAPGAIIGDTTPTLPDPPPPPPVYSSSGGGGGGCGGFGAILVAIVVIVVAVVTGQAWLAEYGEVAMTATECTAGYTAASYAAAAAVGSIASQTVAVALGAQDSFSWTNVALSALGAGVGGVLPGAEAFGEGLGGTIARAATSSLITQGVGVATGLQEHFSWSSVAASAIGAGLNTGLANSGVGQALTNSFSDTVGSSIVGALASGTAHALVFGGKANWANVAADAFGNVMASSVVGRMTAVGNAEQTSVLEEEAQRAWEQGNADLYSQGIVPGGGDVGDELPGMKGYTAGNGGAVGMEITAKRSDPLNQSTRLIYAEDFASDVQQRQQQYAAFLGVNDEAAIVVRPGDVPGDGFEGSRGAYMSETSLFAAERQGMQSYWATQQDGADSFLSYAGAGAMGFLGNLGYRATDMAVALVNDPGSGFTGLLKSAANSGPDAFNGATNAVKASLNGFSLIAETSGLIAPNTLANFRDTSAYNITPLAQYSNDAQAGGGLIGNLVTGAALAKFGGYGAALEDIGTSGPMAFQKGAIGVRFGRFVNVSSREDFLAVSLNPEVNTTYRFDGFSYTTDSLGRALRTEGTLGYSPGNRFSNIDVVIGKTGNAGDIGFHLGADRFGFQGGPLNVVPGNANLNSSAYKSFENQLASHVADGKQVNASFSATYNPGNTSVRPDSFVVRYQLDGGKWINRRFNNRPGG